MTIPENIHTEFNRMQSRADKEAQLRQRAHLFWFYGLSGSGKSTLAVELERTLSAEGYVVKLLDGDNIRSGLNTDLGFSDADRAENIRRIAEVAKLFLDTGIIVLASFMTPTRALRSLAREKAGAADTTPVYVECSFEACAERDVKGLYKKAADGKVAHFTGKDSTFEPPADAAADWRINTQKLSVAEAVEALLSRIRPLIVPTKA